MTPTDHVAENGTIGLVFGGPTDYSGYLNSILGEPTAGRLRHLPPDLLRAT